VVITNLENILKYRFVSKRFLEEALVHSSFVNEHKAHQLSNNERLEFLGDAVLELVTSEYIFRIFANMNEGDMTRLRASVVCEQMLSKKARELGLGVFLKMGKGEDANGGRDRDSILCDVIEAIIGAIYLDGGYGEAKRFILSLLHDEMHRMAELSWTIDCKTHLQEQLQKTSQAPIEYYVVNEQGPDHDKTFTVELSHGGQILSQGSGKNKKEAEQNAAHEAIVKFKLYS
jgi:ribonuclease-3